jgi:hypothetical protein
MPASKSSRQRRSSDRAAAARRGAGGSIWPLAGVVVVLAAISASAVWWFHAHQYLLSYGDAAAHLNIARRVVDCRSFTMKLLGTVWLPLPHLLMLPLVRNDTLWRSGLAGALPMAASFVAAGAFLFAALRRIYGGAAPAVAGVLVFALNPNLLYLQAAPMTEPLFFACLAGVLYFTTAWGQQPRWWNFCGAAAAVLLATLTRYEGWVLIPLAAAYILMKAPRKRLTLAVLFCSLASAGALWWLAHNWWFWGDALEFYRGQWSARAIYERSLAQGMQAYPGDGDWAKAWLYFRTAARLCAGAPLFWMGVAGCAAALVKRAWWPVLLLAAPPAFYVASLRNAGTPIFVPELWPHTYYNARYGLAMLPLLALGAAGLAAVAPGKWRGAVAALAAACAVAPWVMYPRAESWICWKEAQVNSEARRAWTRQAAGFFRENYRRGDGVFFSFGDLTAVMQEAGIPLRETLHDGTEPLWHAALARPDLFARERWVLAMSGDKVADALHHVRTPDIWERAAEIRVRGAPPVEIYKRTR